MGRLHPRRQLRPDRPRLAVGLVEEERWRSWKAGYIRLRRLSIPKSVYFLQEIIVWTPSIIRFLRCSSKTGAGPMTTSAAGSRYRPRRSSAGSTAFAPAARSAASPRCVDHAALGDHTEALIELFFAPGTTLDRVGDVLRAHPEVVDAWSVTGDADALARVRTRDSGDLERLIMALQRDGLVQRTRSQVVLSRLVHR